MTGMPLERGFDHFYDYLNQVHARNYYPEFLWKKRDSVLLKNEVRKIPLSFSPDFNGSVLVKKLSTVMA
ncbi:MAG: hypothetical protein ACLFOZ_09490 [Cyclobacteriaceae bacterium]